MSGLARRSRPGLSPAAAHLQATASAADPSRTVKSGGGDPLAGPEGFPACGGLWQPVAGDGLPLKESIEIFENPRPELSTRTRSTPGRVGG